jgi:hypothetical protein
MDFIVHCSNRCKCEIARSGLQGVCCNTGHPNCMMASEAFTLLPELEYSWWVIIYDIFLAGWIQRRRRLVFKFSGSSVYRSQFTVATLGRMFTEITPFLHPPPPPKKKEVATIFSSWQRTLFKSSSSWRYRLAPKHRFTLGIRFIFVYPYFTPRDNFHQQTPDSCTVSVHKIQQWPFSLPLVVHLSPFISLKKHRTCNSPDLQQLLVHCFRRWKVATYQFINPLALELFFLILAHPIYKMWIIQEPNVTTQH